MGVDQATYGTPRLDLGVALMEYLDSQSNYIGTLALPLTPVGVEAGKFSAIVRESLTARVKTIRGDNGKYSRTGIKAEDIIFACEEHGLEFPISAKVRKRYMNDFDAELAGARKIAGQLTREQEIRIATLLFDAATWTGAALFLQTGTAWSSAAAKIIADVNVGKDKVNANTGMEANTLIVNRNTMSFILANAEIVARVSGAAVATEDVLRGFAANIFGIDQILVGKGIFNTKAEGDAEFVGAQIWSDDFAMVAFVPPNADPEEPAVGRTFLWTEDSPTNMVTESYEEDQTRSTVVRVRQNTDEKLIDKFFGFLIKITV